MKKSFDNNLLIKFLKKETKEEENQQIRDWVSHSEENRKVFRELHESFHLSHLSQYLSEIDVESAWNKIYNQLPVRTEKKQSVFLNPVWRVAAMIVIILAIGGGSFFVGLNLKQNKDTLVQVEAPSGEKSKVLLTDGTHVWLNSGSSLTYNTTDPRKVNVDGEAYFEVAKDKTHPFEVSTPSGMKVTVLGTKFNLRNYDDEKRVEATLDEGQIAISGIHQYKPVILAPGQQADYNLKSGKLVVKNVNPEIFSLWKNNVLRFSDVSFAELVPRIERWYGVSIELDPKISQSDRFTMTIKTESLRELLNMMQLTSKFEYKINGEDVKITAR